MKKIAIIGAGISGLFLANLLERDRSCSYKIYEKKNSLDISDGYGIQLSVNSINLLNKIGFQKLNAIDVFFPKQIDFFEAKNLKKICNIDLSKYNIDNNRYTTLKRSKLIEFLLKNIPKDKIIFNSELNDISHSDKLSLHFNNKYAEKFDYLVAADGVHSKTKEILFKNESSPTYFNSVALRGEIKNLDNYNISLYLGSNFHFVIYPVNQNKEFNFISIIRKKLIQNEISNRNLFKNINFIDNLLEQIAKKSNFNLSNNLREIKCFPIFVSRNIKIPKSKNIFLTGDALFSFPPSFAQGASQSIESANELFCDLKNNTKDYYKKRILKTKQINSRSLFNHFCFHLSNPLNVLLRNTSLKYLSKNKKFLEYYLGKIYKN